MLEFPLDVNFVEQEIFPILNIYIVYVLIGFFRVLKAVQFTFVPAEANFDNVLLQIGREGEVELGAACVDQTVVLDFISFSGVFRIKSHHFLDFIDFQCGERLADGEDSESQKAQNGQLLSHYLLDLTSRY